MTKTANWKDLLHKTIFLVGEIIHVFFKSCNQTCKAVSFFSHINNIATSVKSPDLQNNFNKSYGYVN